MDKVCSGSCVDANGYPLNCSLVRMGGDYTLIPLRTLSSECCRTA